MVGGPMCKVLLPVHAQQGALLAFNQLFSPLVVLWWLRAAIGCSCGAMLYALGRWCAQQCCWVVSTLRTVLLPVHAQHGGLLAFDQLFGPILMSWWLCALYPGAPVVRCWRLWLHTAAVWEAMAVLCSSQARHDCDGDVFLLMYD